MRATGKKPERWSVPLGDLHHASPYAVEERGDTVWLLGHTALVVTRVAEASPWKVALPPIDFARAHAATAALFYAFVEEANEVWAIDVEARRVWGVTLPASSWRPELFVRAGVLVAQRGGLLVAFDADTGAPLWSRTLAAEDAQLVASSSDEGLLLHLVTEGLLLRLDWSTGETRLSRAGLETGWFVGDAGEGRVLLGRDGELVLVEARGGRHALEGHGGGARVRARRPRSGARVPRRHPPGLEDRVEARGHRPSHRRGRVDHLGRRLPASAEGRGRSRLPGSRRQDPRARPRGRRAEHLRDGPRAPGDGRRAALRVGSASSRTDVLALDSTVG
ncbi:MAG: PQQ-binding-like beta-propeller repeat protein [Myxococcales bacterium]|nr:PQQ-binding-like beta-propeller repeat protein [Myxococcales bacterium]